MENHGKSMKIHENPIGSSWFTMVYIFIHLWYLGPGPPSTPTTGRASPSGKGCLRDTAARSLTLDLGT